MISQKAKITPNNLFELSACNYISYNPILNKLCAHNSTFLVLTNNLSNNFTIHFFLPNKMAKISYLGVCSKPVYLSVYLY